MTIKVLPPEEKENVIITIMGRKHSGKSTLALEIMNDGQFPRIFVIDTNAEYGEDRGFETYSTIATGARAMVRVKNKPEFRLAFRDRDIEKLPALLDVAFEIPNTLVVVDETHFYMKPGGLRPEFAQLVFMGRHKAISQIYISQRPVGLNANMTAQSDFIVTFRQQRAADIKWLKDNVADDDAEEVRKLPDFKVKVWSFGDPSKMPLPIVKQIYEPQKNQLDFHREM